MNSAFLEDYARQRQQEIAADFERIHLAGRSQKNRPSLISAILYKTGLRMSRMGERLQEKYRASVFQNQFLECCGERGMGRSSCGDVSAG